MPSFPELSKHWPDRGGAFVHSSHYASREEMEYDTQFKNQLNKFKLNITRIKEKNMVPAKVTKKFYVGKASVINSDWAHANLNDAISHGKALCESSEEDQIIVQVIRVIRVQKRPILVQTVK